MATLGYFHRDPVRLLDDGLRRRVRRAAWGNLLAGAAIGMLGVYLRVLNPDPADRTAGSVLLGLAGFFAVGGAVMLVGPRARGKLQQFICGLISMGLSFTWALAMLVAGAGVLWGVGTGIPMLLAVAVLLLAAVVTLLVLTARGAAVLCGPYAPGPPEA